MRVQVGAIYSSDFVLRRIGMRGCERSMRRKGKDRGKGNKVCTNWGEEKRGTVEGKGRAKARYVFVWCVEISPSPVF